MSVPASVDQARQTRDDVTTLLRDWRNGNPSALDRLTPSIYEDLIRLARARLKGERREFTLGPTALVHECYLRLADQTRLDVESRAHFYSIAANVMRRALIDNARKRNAQKRNAGLRITFPSPAYPNCPPRRGSEARTASPHQPQPGSVGHGVGGKNSASGDPP